MTSAKWNYVPCRISASFKKHVNTAPNMAPTNNPKKVCLHLRKIRKKRNKKAQPKNNEAEPPSWHCCGWGSLRVGPHIDYANSGTKETPRTRGPTHVPSIPSTIGRKAALASGAGPSLGGPLRGGGGGLARLPSRG